MRAAFDLEDRAHGIHGPVSGGAADVAILQIGSQRVVIAVNDVVSLGVSVGRGADSGDAGSFFGATEVPAQEESIAVASTSREARRKRMI